MKLLRNIVISLLLLFGVLIISALLIEHYYGDRIRANVIERLNQHLSAEVQVDEVELSVLSKFPYASVRLSNVELQENGPVRDTLFHFKEVFLQFQLFDLFREEQRIERISFEDGELFLTIDRNGEHGLDIWKEKEGESLDSTSSAAFELERVEWQNVLLHYEDLRSELRFRSELSYAFLQARFNQERSELRTRVNGTWHFLDTGEESWMELNKSYSLEASGIIDQRNKRIEVGSSELSWEGLQVSSEGQIHYGEKDPRMKLSYELPFQSLSTYTEAWPNPLSKNETYLFDGEIRVKGELEGPMGDGESPVLDSELELREGKVEEKKSGIRAEGLEGKARFISEGENGGIELTLEKLVFQLGGGEWEGRGILEGGRRRSFALGIQGESPVSETVRFLGIDTLRTASGDWNGALQVRGEIPENGEWGEKALKGLTIDGKAELVDASFAVKGNPNLFEELNGSFLLYDMNAKVVDFRGRVLDSDFELNGRFQGLLPYLFLPDRTLGIHSEFRSERVELDQLLSSDEAPSSSEEYRLEFPKHIYLRLRTEIGELSFKEFKASDIEGELEVGPGGFNAQEVKLQLAEGSLKGGVRIHAGNEPYRLRAMADLKRIDIRAFFEAFGSFGQKILRPQHLKGRMDAHIEHASTLQKDLSIPAASVTSSGELEIRKGELIRFRPLLDLGDELAEKRVLNSFLDLEGLKERLKRVRFATLRNRLRIENETLIIPHFEVSSNAIDITASGEHGFDGTIDYRFSLLLDELLSKPKESEFGYLKEEGDRKRLFVRMSGHVDDPEVGMDREAAREHRKERREEEKESIKEVLRKEFGLFKKDSSQTNEEEKEKEEASPVFEVKWGDEEEEKKEAEARKDSSKSFWERLGIGKKKDDEEE